MNPLKYLATGAAALLCITTVQAETLVRFTGSTAFRASAVAAMENLMGGPGNFKAAYQSSSGSSAGASNQCIIQGNIPGLPAGANPVTIQCSWSGSTGGIKTVVQSIPVATWMSASNLPATNSSVGVAGTPAYDAAAPADVTMEDSSQASTGFTSITLTETRVGVLAFEWVAGNGSPANLDNITPLLAQAVISGGAPLSQFTANPADVATPVYMLGRNFDSGTRLVCLANTGVGVFGGVQHVQPIVSGTGGSATISGLKLWSAESVLGQAFSIGQSGFNSGGTLADNLATPGATTANTTTGIPPAEQVGFGPGVLISFLGRTDASRACRTTVIAGNNAHRMKWNGYQLWNGPIAANGTPASYNDNLVSEGLYSLWEYQNLAYRSTFGQTSPNGKAVADAIAARIASVEATLSGTKLSDMNVSKAVEGGIITHN